MKTRTRRLLLITLLCLAAVGGRNARASSIAVTSTADDGPGSLRRALVLAAAGDTLSITASGTITLTSGQLIVNKSLTIRGPGKANLSVSGNDSSRVFYLAPNPTVSLEGITQGRAAGSNFTGRAAASLTTVFPAGRRRRSPTKHPGKTYAVFWPVNQLVTAAALPYFIGHISDRI